MKVFDSSELGDDWLDLYMEHDSEPTRGYNTVWLDNAMRMCAHGSEIYDRLIAAGAVHGETVLVEWDW
jgi:hypothetical protein